MTGRSTMVNVGKSTANKQQQEDNVYGGKKRTTHKANKNNTARQVKTQAHQEKHKTVKR